MTIKECYELAGGNYEEVMGRLLKEERVVKYLGKFKADPSYNEMLQSYAAQDWETLFRSSHTLKGVCYNLSLTALGDAADAVCEAVRPGVAPKTDIAPMVEETKVQYARTIELIEKALPQA